MNTWKGIVSIGITLSGVVLTVILVFSSHKASAEDPTEITVIRNVTETGVRLNANQTTYVQISGDPVGPAQCASTFLKADLNNPEMAGAEDMVRRMLIAAKLGNRQIKISVSLTECLYGNPTFNAVRLVN